MRSATAKAFVAGLVVLAASLSSGAAAAKPHVITFGKWTSVPWFAANDDGKPLTLKVRALLVDGRVKEFILGSTHDVTDRLFVVQRVFRINDSLPEEKGNPRWKWERGGWLLVDRTTGRVSALSLPQFDAFYSSASWFRDYAAYCGVSDDGKKVFAMVAQLARRKPVMKNALPGAGLDEDSAPESACSPPAWQRAPTRVSFEVPGSPKQTFAIRGHVVDLVNDAEEEEGSK